MRTNEHLVVFRSKPFNLKTDNGRKEAVKAVVLLLGYLKSGDAKMEGTAQGILDCEIQAERQNFTRDFSK